ncbi:MAG: thioredoxin family protein [Planctomycetaceae bacterium]
MSFNCLPMRVLLVAFVLLTSLSQAAVANEIPWSTDIEGSLQKAAAAGRPVLMEFTVDCMYCMYGENDLVDPRVVKFVNQHYVAVRIDADEHKQLVADLDIKGLPAILVVSPTLQIIERIPGFQTPEALMTKLSRASAGSQQQVVQNVANNRQVQPPVVARSASAAKPAETQPTKQELQFEPIETETTPAEEGTEEEPQFTFEAITEQETIEPATKEVSDEELTAKAEDAADSRKEAKAEDDFFATVSQKKPQENNTPTPKSAVDATFDSPEFEGHCLVAAVVNREIVDGSPRHQTKYRGHLLYFSTEEAKQEFLAHPNEYWPLFDGICSVTMLNDEERAMGRLEYAAFFRKRLWLFSSEENLKQFLEDPADVAEGMQELAESKSGR